MTTGKTTAWTRRTVVDKVMSLLFNTLSRFIIKFLPRKEASFKFMAAVPSAVILEPKYMKAATI